MEITSFEKVEVSSTSLLSSSLPDLHYQSLQTLQQQHLTSGQQHHLPYLSAENLMFAAASASSSATALGIAPPLPSSSGNSTSGVSIAPTSSSSSSSSGQQQHPDHYKNLKMKYYRSLGVQNGAAVSNTGSVPSSLPNNTGSQLMEQRTRTHTVTVPSIVRQMVPPNRDTPMSPRKKRSTSTPIPITMPQPIPGAPNRNAPTFSSDEEEEEEEEIPDLQQDEFIPPHEMLAKQHQNGFAVGTAHSVAVWEQKRRNMMNVNV